MENETKDTCEWGRYGKEFTPEEQIANVIRQLREQAKMAHNVQVMDLKAKLANSREITDKYIKENGELQERIETMRNQLDFRQRLNEDLVKLLEEANKKLASQERKKDNLDFLDGQIQELEGILEQGRLMMKELRWRFTKPQHPKETY